MEIQRNNATCKTMPTSTEIFWRILEADQDLNSRLRDRVDTLPSGCILWRGPSGREPRVKIQGKAVSVRRLLWEAVHGPLPAGKRIRAYCGTDGCVNPEHLFRNDSPDKPAVKRVRPPLPSIWFRVGHLLYQGWTEGTLRVMLGERFGRTARSILDVCLADDVSDDTLKTFSGSTGIPMRVLKKIIRSQTRRDIYGQPRTYRPLSDAPEWQKSATAYKRGGT